MQVLHGAFAGKASHFFTASEAECEQLKANAAWTYEGVEFYARVPDAQGNCGADTAAVHRLYNAGRGGAPNHAYTADVSKKNTLAGAGWVAEGVAFCAPLATPEPEAQVMVLFNSLWDIPPKSGYLYTDTRHRKSSGRIRTFTTENYEAASATFQNYQLSVPPALIAHTDYSGTGFVIRDDGSYYVNGGWLGAGGAGWDALAGEYVLVMTVYYSSPPLRRHDVDV